MLDSWSVPGIPAEVAQALLQGGVAFYKKTFANPQGLVELVAKSRGAVKIQPDQKIVFRGEWDMPEARLKGVRELAQQLATLAGAGKKAA